MKKMTRDEIMGMLSKTPSRYLLAFCLGLVIIAAFLGVVWGFLYLLITKTALLLMSLIVIVVLAVMTCSIKKEIIDPWLTERMGK
jgi:hypothetical protein